MNIYPDALEAVCKIVAIFEEVSQSSVEDDSGVILGSMPLYTTDGRLIGAVNVDEDEHAYFTPAEDDYDEDDGPEDGEHVFTYSGNVTFLPTSDFAPTVADLTVRGVG